MYNKKLYIKEIATRIVDENGEIIHSSSWDNSSLYYNEKDYKEAGERFKAEVQKIYDNFESITSKFSKTYRLEIGINDCEVLNVEGVNREEIIDNSHSLINPLDLKVVDCGIYAFPTLEEMEDAMTRGMSFKEALYKIQIQNDGWSLEYINIKDQTPEICLESVKQNGSSLEYVKDQTPEICLAAVKKSGCALKYVKNQTPEICLEAVKKNARALRYVKEQTKEICIAALEYDSCLLLPNEPRIFEYVDESLKEEVLEALNQK